MPLQAAAAAAYVGQNLGTRSHLTERSCHFIARLHSPKTATKRKEGRIGVVPRSALRWGDRIVLKSRFEAVTDEAVANTAHARRFWPYGPLSRRSHATAFSLFVGR